jgi:hypothetical protein
MFVILTTQNQFKHFFMKKILLFLALVCTTAIWSQTHKQRIQNYLDSQKSTWQLTAADVSDWTIDSEVYAEGTQITSCYIVQNHQGIAVFNAQSNVSIKNNAVYRLANNFKSNIAQKINTTQAQLTVEQAALLVYQKLQIAQPTAFSILESLPYHKYTLTDGIQEDPISAQLVYQSMPNEQLRLAWYFQFYSPDAKHLWDLRIDALTGSILEQNDLMLSCSFGHPTKTVATKAFNFSQYAFNKNSSSIVAATPGTYRVIPITYESPNHHPFELITTAGNALASPNGWHDANAIGGTTASLKYTYTRGNNVLAQEDADGNNGNGIRPDAGASLVFDYQYGGPTFQPTAYTPAATTNLFYAINEMHDIWYQYGFTEAAGNFQQNNLGRGGTNSGTGDYVLADAQDGYSQTTPTLNNANFSTPNDGTRPRVQMFLWTMGAPATNFLTVNSPASIAGEKLATSNVFEGTDRIPVPTAPNGITSDLALYTNNPNPPGYNSACQAPTNAFALSNKIVLIRRGGCFFNLKVKNAQDAGALAVIVTDSIPNNPTTLSMSSTGLLGITIPAIFITKELGDELIAEMANGPVNVKLESPGNLYLYADGDFDNGIIAHEIGHGISNRLIGGPNNTSCMVNAEQMGEGWSDWFCLMNQIKVGDTGAEAKGIGTYAINQLPTGGGIRNYPYSTDMSVNPLTLVNSNDAESHNRGETWTAVLWDLTWAYINKYGFDPDIYTGTGGNNKVMRLVMDALKLQSCNTSSFISSRDNLFAADQATTEGQDYCLIADVFQRRGMGLNASSGSVDNALDQVEDFTAFPPGPNCTLAVDYFANPDLIRIYPNPSQGDIQLRINQFVGKLNIKLVDTNGRIVFEENDNTFQLEKTLHLGNLQKGVYLLQLSGDQLKHTQKVVIN